MGDEFLAKVKGFKGVFVVHSNTNPYAAAAAMGMLAAQSQQEGAYFRVFDDLIPQVEPSAESPNESGQPGQIEADFLLDWVTYLRNTGLPACGLLYDDLKEPEGNTVRFLNAFGRRIPPKCAREVRESRELQVPQRFQAEYTALANLIRAGGDFKPYLSRDILKRSRADKNDGQRWFRFFGQGCKWSSARAI